MRRCARCAETGVERATRAAAMKRDLARLLFSTRGRLSRAPFWWTALALDAGFVLLFVVIDEIVGQAATLVIYPFTLWIGFALCAKRMRDRGRSPGWLAAALVPLAGPLWLLIELGFRRGTSGDNAYGPDPLIPSGARALNA